MDFQCVFWNERTEKHQTSTAFWELSKGNWATPPLPLSRLRSSTSTPKPRAEGSSPSAPAKNREASTMLTSLFFVSAHKDSATRHGCALRSACRGVSERQWRSAANRPRRQPRPSPSAPATKPAKTLGFRRFSVCLCCTGMGFTLVRTPGFPIRLHLPLTVLIPSSTQNAAGFAFFGPIRVRFPCFFPFLTCKIFRIFFVHSADLVHRLKSLVMPLSRDVSFLT